MMYCEYIDTCGIPIEIMNLYAKKTSREVAVEVQLFYNYQNHSVLYFVYNLWRLIHFVKGQTYQLLCWSSIPHLRNYQNLPSLSTAR